MSTLSNMKSKVIFDTTLSEERIISTRNDMLIDSDGCQDTLTDEVVKAQIVEMNAEQKAEFISLFSRVFKHTAIILYSGYSVLVLEHLGNLTELMNGYSAFRYETHKVFKAEVNHLILFRDGLEVDYIVCTPTATTIDALHSIYLQKGELCVEGLDEAQLNFFSLSDYLNGGF